MLQGPHSGRSVPSNATVGQRDAFARLLPATSANYLRTSTPSLIVFSLHNTQHHTRHHTSISRYMLHNNNNTIHSTRLPKLLPPANSATRSFVLSPPSNPAPGGKHSASLPRAPPHSTGVGQVAVRGEVLRLAPVRGRGTAVVDAGICCDNTSQGCSQEAWVGGFPCCESLQGGFW
jgi:hypothetical protein